MSTHPNEAVSSRLTSTGARAHLPRPHLVSAAEKGAQPEPIAEAIQGGGIALDPDRPDLHGFDPHSLTALPERLKWLPTSTWSFGATTKRILDIVGAVMLGLIFSPLMLVIVVLTHREGGSVIYQHRRVGRGGKMFGCLKFRTMVPDADQVLRDLLERDTELRAEWIRDHKLRNDPRVTRLGRFLRRTSLDELPQIWNVLRGEMSLVGPRPVVREELLRYGRNIGSYLTSRPGITGLWQVTGRNDTDYRRRVALDTYYVRNQNLLLDLYILSKTTLVVLGGSGAY